MIQKLFSEGGELGKDENFDEQHKYGSIKYLVSRALEPLVSSHFRFAAQNRDIMEFQQNLKEIQRSAEETIRNGLDKYGVEASGTHINEIELPNDIAKHIQAQAQFKEERKAILEEQLLPKQKFVYPRSLQKKQKY